MADVVRVVSLFCGCGGMDLGFTGGFNFLGRHFRKNRVAVLRAVDSDALACTLYRLNLGEVACADVREIRDWPAADLVIGGPPCQSYSAAGLKKGSADERDGLPAFIDVVRRVMPRAFVLENVPGLCTRRRFASDFEILLSRLAGLGFDVRHRVLDAADFGVPQHRRRLFIIGLRPDRESPSPFPEPTHGPRAGRPYRCVRDALADLHLPFHEARFRKLREGQRRHPSFGASSRRLVADEPFPTVKASDTASNRMIHPWFDRFLTMPELLRAQSFPDSFIVPKRTAAVGNAVPPVLAWHVAVGVLRALRQAREKT